MKRIRILLTVSVGLGLVSLAFFVLGRLAMTDIFHGEPDLALEWNIVSLSFLPVLAFHLVSIVAAIAAIRQINKAAASH